MKPGIIALVCGASVSAILSVPAAAQDNSSPAIAVADGDADVSDTDGAEPHADGYGRDRRGERRNGHRRNRDADMGRHAGDARDTDVSTIIVTGRRNKKSYRAQSGVGSKVKEDPRDVPQSIAVISRQRLEDQNIRTNAEALAQIPGFNSTSPEGFYTLRGFTTGVSVDGAPSGSIAGRTDVDVEVFEQIEVLKGAAALLQGNGDAGGVVNYVFKKPTNSFAASAKIGAGSFNNFYGGLDIGGPLTRDRSLRARAVGFYEDRDIFTRPEDRKRLTLYGTLQYDVTSRTTASIGYHYQKAVSSEGFRQGLPTYSDGTLLDVSPRSTLSQDWNHWTKLSTSMLADIEHRFGGDWIAKLAWRRGRSRLPSVVAYTGPVRGSPSACKSKPGIGGFLTRPYAGVDPSLPYDSLLCMHTEYYDDRTGTDSIDGFVSGSIDVGGIGQKVLIGYNRRKEHFQRGLADSNGVNDFVIDVLNPDPHVIDRPPLEPVKYGLRTTTSDEGIYGRVVLSPVEWLKVPVGGRFSWVTDSLGRKTASGKFIPYLGVIADVSREFSLYASYAESFTPAGATVRIWNGTRGGGDPVPPVTGKQYEIGVKGAFLDGRLQAAAAIFQIERINATSTDPDPTHTGGDVSYVILTGQRKTKGVEAQVNGEITPNWSIGASYAYTDAIVTKDVNYQGEIVNGVPRHALILFTNFKVTEGELDGFSIGGGLRGQTKQIGAFPCTKITRQRNPTDPNCGPRIVGPRYATVSLRAGYKIDRNMDIALNVDNLFDKTYWQAVTSRAGQNYFGSPRTFQVTLRSRY